MVEVGVVVDVGVEVGVEVEVEVEVVVVVGVEVGVGVGVEVEVEVVVGVEVGVGVGVEVGIRGRLICRSGGVTPTGARHPPAAPSLRMEDGVLVHWYTRLLFIVVILTFFADAFSKVVYLSRHEYPRTMKISVPIVDVLQLLLDVVVVGVVFHSGWGWP